MNASEDGQVLNDATANDVTVTTSVVYDAWESLEPLNAAQLESLAAACSRLDDSEWKTQFETLTLIQRAAKHHPQELPTDTLLDSVVACCGSLRSSLAKNAFLTLCALAKSNTLSDRLFVKRNGKPTSPTATHAVNSRLKSIFSILLNKASSTAEKRFINSAAESCINSLVVVSDLTPMSINLITAALTEHSKNSRLLTACGNALLAAWRALLTQGTMDPALAVSISHAAALLLNDRLPSSRQAGRALIAEMAKAALASPRLSNTVHAAWQTTAARLTVPAVRSTFQRALPSEKSAPMPRRSLSSSTALTRDSRPFSSGASTTTAISRKQSLPRNFTSLPRSDDVPSTDLPLKSLGRSSPSLPPTPDAAPKDLRRLKTKGPTGPGPASAGGPVPGRASLERSPTGVSSSRQSNTARDLRISKSLIVNPPSRAVSATRKDTDMAGREGPPDLRNPRLSRAVSREGRDRDRPQMRLPPPHRLGNDSARSTISMSKSSHREGRPLAQNGGLMMQTAPALLTPAVTQSPARALPGKITNAAATGWPGSTSRRSRSLARPLSFAMKVNEEMESSLSTTASSYLVEDSGRNPGRDPGRNPPRDSTQDSVRGCGTDSVRGCGTDSVRGLSQSGRRRSCSLVGRRKVELASPVSWLQVEDLDATAISAFESRFGLAELGG